MSTNLHTLQQQISEGLTLSMAKCQQLESALKAAQDRNVLLENEIFELRHAADPTLKKESSETDNTAPISLETAEAIKRSQNIQTT
jgi:hypothetical protein